RLGNPPSGRERAKEGPPYSRKLDHESCAVTPHVLKTNGSAVTSRDLPDDEESESQTAHGRRCGALESLENPLLSTKGDAGAAILDHQTDRRRAARERNFHGFARSVFDDVPQ